MSQFAKQALMAKHAYVAALLAGTAALAGAQPATGGPGNMGSGDGPGRGGMMMHRDGGHGDPAKMQARMAKRAAELKTKLKLAPEQEAAWTTFTEAMKPPADASQRAERPNPVDMAALSTPERIDKMRAMHDKRHEAMTTAMNRRGEAVKTFYATLTADQKKVFDAEAMKIMGPRGRGGPGMGEHKH